MNNTTTTPPATWSAPVQFTIYTEDNNRPLGKFAVLAKNDDQPAPQPHQQHPQQPPQPQPQPQPQQWFHGLDVDHNLSWHGTAEVVQVWSAGQFADVLRAMQPNQVLIYGVPISGPVARIVPSKECPNGKERADGAHPRDRAHFVWPAGPGVFMLDVDDCTILHQCNMDSASWVWGQVYQAAPANQRHLLASCAVVHAPSASARLGLKHSLGCRFYLFAQHADDIVRAGQVLYEACWEAFGYVEVDKGGSLRVKSVLDRTVYQPERLDFIGPPSKVARDGKLVDAPPVCIFVRDGTLLDTALALPDNETAHYSFEQAVESEKQLLRPHAAALRERLIESNVSAAVQHLGMLERGVLDATIATPEGKRSACAAIERGTLPGFWVLHPAGFPPVLVRDVVANWEAWRGKRCADPVDPDYRHDNRVAMFSDSDSPSVYTHAHGGQVWELQVPFVQDACVAALYDAMHGGDE